VLTLYIKPLYIKVRPNILAFVVADSTKSPYKFELLPDVFNVHSQYGTVSLEKSCLLVLAIVEGSVSPISRGMWL